MYPGWFTRRTFALFGYGLVVDEATVAYVARILARPRLELGTRAGIGLLRAGAERLLLDLLQRRAPPGTTAVLSSDDIRVPDPPTGIWRE